MCVTMDLLVTILVSRYISQVVHVPPVPEAQHVLGPMQGSAGQVMDHRGTLQ